MHTIHFMKVKMLSQNLVKYSKRTVITRRRKNPVTRVDSKMAPGEKHICNKCSKTINLRTQKHLFCEGECQKAWHVPKCYSVSEERYNELVHNEEITWFCDPCEKRRTKRRSTMNISTNSNNASNGTPQATPSTTSIPQDNSSNATLQVILKELQELKVKQTESIQHITDLKNALEGYKVVTDNLTQENVALRNDNEILRSKINKIENALNNTDQQQKLDHNLVINGITETENENTTDLIINFANTIDVELTPENIISANRVATANKDSGLPKSIIVQLNDKNKRDSLLKNRKKQTNKNRPIYITEQLSTKQQFIFKKARDLKREKKIKFAWVKDGKILIRKTEDSRAVNLTNINELNVFNNASQ